MMNALEEFKKHIGSRRVKCAELFTGIEEEKIYYRLKSDYDPVDLSIFLASLDFEYDSGFGWQELFGFIWYEDGTWSERDEYDGREWWEHKYCPAIPQTLISAKPQQFADGE